METLIEIIRPRERTKSRFVINYCPACIYLFKIKTKNTRIMCEISVKLTIKAPKRTSIVEFEQKNAGWVITSDVHYFDDLLTPENT